MCIRSDLKPLFETDMSDSSYCGKTLNLISILSNQQLLTYRKVASSKTSHLEAHADFFRLFMKGIFDAYVL